jgi:hypothetical protein
MFSSQNITNFQDFIKNFVVGGMETFEEARNNAKNAGKLLAHCVSHGFRN